MLPSTSAVLSQIMFGTCPGPVKSTKLGDKAGKARSVSECLQPGDGFGTVTVIHHFYPPSNNHGALHH